MAAAAVATTAAAAAHTVAALTTGFACSAMQARILWLLASQLIWVVANPAVAASAWLAEFLLAAELLIPQFMFRVEALACSETYCVDCWIPLPQFQSPAPSVLFSRGEVNLYARTVSTVEHWAPGGWL